MAKKTVQATKKNSAKKITDPFWFCLNQPTSFSKIFAAVLFSILPFVGFFIGMAFQAKLISYYLPY